MAEDQAAVRWQHWRLVNGHELYDVNTDLGQNNDLAAVYPDIVSRLHDHYQTWWDGVGQNLDRYHRHGQRKSDATL